MGKGINPTRIAREGLSIPDELSIDADYSGDDADWDTAPGVAGEDQWKQPVRCATTAAVTIATALNAGDTVDGVTLVAGDRVLVKDQGTASQNGIYVAGSTPVRAADMDDDSEVVGAVVYVVEGGTNAGTAWAVTSLSPVVVDTDAIDWAAFGGGGAPGSGDTTGQLVWTWDGGGDVIDTAVTVDVVAPYTGTITGWTLLGDGTGSAVVDLWSDVYANWPPTVADTITASAKPTVSAATKAASTTLTGWDTAIAAGDILRASLDSLSGFTRLVLVLDYSRP